MPFDSHGDSARVNRLCDDWGALNLLLTHFFTHLGFLSGLAHANSTGDIRPRMQMLTDQLSQSVRMPC